MIIASFWRRVAAFLIDIIPLTILLSLIAYFFFGFDELIQNRFDNRHDHQAAIEFYTMRNLIRELTFIIWIIYSAAMECSPYQGTLGKILMGIKVVDDTGKPLSVSKAIARNLFKIVSYLPLSLGFIWALFNKRRKGWHDFFAKTLVAKRVNP